MSPTKLLRGVVIVLALVVWCAAPSGTRAASSLSQLRGVDELKSWFNAHKGRPRLIFLVSPT